MALHLQTLKIRTLSAIVYLVVFLGSIFWNNWLFLLFCLFIHGGAWYEFQRIAEKINPKLKTNSAFHNVGIIFSGAAFILFSTNETFYLSFISLGELGWWFLLIAVLILPIIDILFSEYFYVPKIYFDVIGFLYLSLSIAFLLKLKITPIQNPNGELLPTNVALLLMIFSIWLTDTMAYIGGSLFGKTPFFPSISPKKTWEGTLFGILFSLSAGIIVVKKFFPQFFLLFSTIVFVSAVLGTIGDLVESKLKRMAKIKDSGNIMPGHGGFLDRFDSILIATPFVWLIVYIYQFL